MAEAILEPSAGKPVCAITKVSRPSKPLKAYKDVTGLVPYLKQHSSQAHVVAAVLGGQAPARGVVMLDTGAALSIITEKVCDVHGLKMKGPGGKYITSSKEEATLVGSVDMTLQFNNQFQVELQGVSVQPGSEYQVLIGGDMLWGKKDILGDVSVTPGRHATFTIPFMEHARFDVPCVAQKLTPPL